MNLKYRNIRYKFIVLVGFIILLCISCIKPVYPSEMFLQHFITIFMIVFLAVIIKNNSLSDRSFTLIIAFLILHIIGARWIYSYVPYDKWIESLTGSTLSDIIGSNRNHYDRFVHLMFGLMILPPLREIYIKWFRAPDRFASILAFLSILGISLVYEVFEWGLTLVLSPQDAENYNGQQGDMWDAQKDMALAMAGSMLALIIKMVNKIRTRRIILDN